MASPGKSSAVCTRTTQKSWPVGARVTHQVFTWRSTGDGYANLVNLNSNKCLTVVNGSTTAGAALEQRTCSTATSMQWSRA